MIEKVIQTIHNWKPTDFLQHNINSDVNVHSKSSANRGVTPIDQVLDMGAVKTQHTNHTNYTTRKTGTDRSKYIHDDINLERVLPGHEAITNKGQNIYKQQKYENKIQLDRNMPTANAYSNKTDRRVSNTNNNSRDYKLIPKINAGGFVGRGNRPLQATSHTLKNLDDSRKVAMNRSINEQFQRF